jgi:alkanesulfonate monooxygenase SsuD/methylene tetrahydromethanopterin reductase-like flavin-dependent oxidoreductase (luciferase family)
VGDPAEVTAELATLLDRTGADELMVTTMVHSHDDRVQSYRLVADLAGVGPSGAGAVPAATSGA